MLQPMLTLMLWTLLVALYLLALRVRSVRRGEVSLGYFRLNSGPSAPSDRALAAARHYDNLFQVPVLFYLACVTTLALGLNGPIALAWGFVVLRVIHGLIHLSYNNVRHRFAAFMAANLLLIAIWASIALQLGSRG
ncbi:MAPEG family protein [Marinimicrobium sp. ARAG 43.8]|uniref:MAPEG family protein n=1 Tax=Marinimicrobium sp. ARAG 43.8 TaxID=3418719 RepID=UPI003CEE364E